MKRFKELNKEEKDEIRLALAKGNLQVHCPWWTKDRWEDKGKNSWLFDECFYRIKINSDSGYYVTSDKNLAKLLRASNYL